ncbi:uncharacterized protein YER152C isoform X1 [Strongylocentrotus purpuratus]|uniref:Aminotransferase class I/classII large domain-containing protein n=1 Tax=Strongylocentrotus purpuratus TaxID=7668 RepID=A0A7M7PM45_STRPU|nr:uncharacterized protein YER152C isoform X1 [Strongylocentrotus purpuratus]
MDMIKMEHKRVSVDALGRMSNDELKRHGYFASEQAELNFNLSPGMIALSSGRPGEDILRKSSLEIQKATHRRFTEELADDCDLLQYGSLQGDPTFRIQMAKFLTRRYQSPVHSDNILCNAGASQGLNFLSTHFFKKGDVVFVEDPTYFLALAAFQHDQQLNVVPVAKEDDGVDTEDLEKKLSEHLGDRQPDDTRPFRSLLYLIPCFHNPTGSCTSSEKMKSIIRMARKYDLLVVCDDVYNVLSWQPADEGSDRKYKCPARLFAFDNPSDPDFKGNVVSNGSVSKFLAPGLRLGWFEASDRIIDLMMKNQYLDSGGSFNHLTGGIVGTMLKMGIVDDHLDFVCNHFKTNVDVMTKVLKEELPPGVKFSTPEGGYFFWLELPKSVDVAKLSAVCREKYKVNFAPGRNFSSTPKFDHFIRLSFSYYPAEKLADGAKKICQAIKEVMGS